LALQIHKRIIHTAKRPKQNQWDVKKRHFFSHVCAVMKSQQFIVRIRVPLREEKSNVFVEKETGGQGLILAEQQPHPQQGF
jgi:hypothetical protein